MGRQEDKARGDRAGYRWAAAVFVSQRSSTRQAGRGGTPSRPAASPFSAAPSAFGCCSPSCSAALHPQTANRPCMVLHDTVNLCDFADSDFV
jgi:hypothetical protein